MNICICNLSSSGLDDETLLKLINNTPPRSIILLEDADACIVSRKQSSENSRITFSGLLNALDGVASFEGRILFMTSNLFRMGSNVDAALLRPGRIDMEVYFGCANRFQAMTLFARFASRSSHCSLFFFNTCNRFFPDEPLSSAARFADSLPEEKLSMAAIQGHLIRYRTPSEALDVTELLESLRSAETHDSV